jgi:hypothetical protein
MLLITKLYIDEDRMFNEYGAVGGMKIGRGNQSDRKKPAPLSLCPPQIPHDLTWDKTLVACGRKLVIA